MLRTTSILGISLVLVLCHLPNAHAEPTDEMAGMDSAEERAKVLMEVMEKHQAENKLEAAYEAVSTAHRLQPTLRSACVAGVMALKLKRDVDAARSFRDCVRRAIAENLKARDKKMWRLAQADYERARSRVGALRVIAPPFTEILIDDRRISSAEAADEIFVEANQEHKIAGQNEFGAMHAKARLSPGETSEAVLSFEPEAVQPKPLPAPLPLTIFSPLPPPPQWPENHGVHPAAWLTVGMGAGAFVGAAILGGYTLSTYINAQEDMQAVKGYELHKCDPADRRYNEACDPGVARAREAGNLAWLTLGAFGLSLALEGTAYAIHVTTRPEPSPAWRSAGNTGRSTSFMLSGSF